MSVPDEVKHVVCTTFSPIYYDRLKDTDATIKAVRDYDALYVGYCGKSPASK